jgi:FkbM family methyltransferase
MGARRDAWKHWYRRTAVGIAPRAYWRSRFSIRGYEERELSLLPQLCREHSMVIDVGANLGMHSYWLTQLAQNCIAFEPIPALAKALRRGFGKRLRVENVALSDVNGVAELIVPRLSPGLSTIEKRNVLSEGAVRNAERVQVPTRRLDDYALTDVSFVKIDVEGHEEAVLRGAAALISAERPTLLLELEERHNPGCIERVANMLNQYGLEGAIINDERLTRLSDFDVVAHQRNVSEALYIRNFIFARPEVFDRLRL